MKKQQKVYAIAVGDYSDYHIEGIFSTRELAEECMEACGMAWADIEEYDLDEPADKVRRGMKPFSVEILRDGSIHRIRKVDFLLRSAHPYLYQNNQLQSVILLVHLWARDEIHATKIANEKRTSMIASNLWPTQVDYGTITECNRRLEEMYKAS